MSVVTEEVVAALCAQQKLRVPSHPARDTGGGRGRGGWGGEMGMGRHYKDGE